MKSIVLTVTAIFSVSAFFPADARAQFQQAAAQRVVTLHDGHVLDPDSRRSFEELLELAEKRGRITIIADIDDAEMLNESREPDLEEIYFAQQKFLDYLDSKRAGRFTVKWRYEYTPSVALIVDKNALLSLENYPLLVQITEDVPQPVHLNDTVSIIGAEQVHDLGYLGEGQAVAILDTGVERSHPFLNDKVAHEHCFSTTNDDYLSICPNGQSEMGGIGSAVPCDYHASCYHGTHVAGIAAGKIVSEGIRGVAPAADIIAINVFSRPRNGGGVSAFISDQKKALEHIYSLRNEYSIAALNMSLGSNAHAAHCDNDTRKSMIDNLRSAGILTVISSGNDHHKDGIGAPACISSAISVGNTQDNDTVNSSSNSAEILDMLAPGTSVLSSDLDTGLAPTYRNRTGTSMAAPHVAGAIALIKEKQPTWTADQIEDALTSHGPLITDTNGIARRRLDIGAILNTPNPVVRAEYTGCAFSQTGYAIDWQDMNNSEVTEWDVDIATYDGGTWYPWYNGTASFKSLQFNGSKRKVRVRGANAQGWGSFRNTPWLHDLCDSDGGPHPKVIPAGAP